MLIYDPTLDPYHCSVRVLTILEFSGAKALELEAVRIADFFLAYPSALVDFRFYSADRQLRRHARNLANPYRTPIGARSSFERMRPIFQAATSGLVAVELIDREIMKAGRVERTAKSLPGELLAAMEKFKSRQTVVRDFIVSKLSTMPLLGADGLKHRSGLMEHRYDAT